MSWLKKVGEGVLGFVGMAVLVVLGLALVFGIVRASVKVLPWLVSISHIAFGICLFFLLPMCIFRKLRPWAGIGFAFASYTFGILLFALSCIYVVQVWGYGALVGGLIFAGVGVVPVALLAALVHGQWSDLGTLFWGVVLTFGTRILGLWLSGTESTAAESEALE